MPDSTRSIIVNGDEILIMLTPPCVAPSLLAPLPLFGTGHSTVNDQPVCVEGDEYPLAISNNMQVPYFTPPYVVPGMAIVKITLADENKTSIATDKDKKVLLKGTTFQVELDVTIPAMMPTPAGPQPDPMLKHPGTAMFITTNTLIVSH